MGKDCCQRTGPVSNLSSISKIVTQASLSPRNNVNCTGAGPRRSGSFEKWILNVPNFGLLKTASGIIWPKSATIPKSDSISDRVLRVDMGILCSIAHNLVADGVKTFFRPTSLSERVTTSSRLKFLCKLSNTGRQYSEVPKKIIFIVQLLPIFLFL